MFLSQYCYICNNYIDRIYDHNDNRVCIQSKTFSFFLFFNFIEELVGIFCPPCSTIFHIPFTGLYLPIRNIVFYSKRRYIPYYIYCLAVPQNCHHLRQVCVRICVHAESLNDQCLVYYFQDVQSQQ